MTEVLLDKETGLANPAVFPCYRGKGLCKIRRRNNGHFECSQEPEQCQYRVIEALGRKRKGK